jgi:hypothetical protein
MAFAAWKSEKAERESGWRSASESKNRDRTVTIRLALQHLHLLPVSGGAPS